MFGQDIGIDLGTSTVLVYVKGRGIIDREPCVVAVDSGTDRIIAVGAEAQKMLGRTPGNIIAVQLLKTVLFLTIRQLKECSSILFKNRRDTVLSERL